MAIDILSILAISDTPERVFSGGRCIILQKRARLGAKNIKRVECLKYYKQSGIIKNKLSIIS